MLLDMDGTLIDLHFDSVLWNEALPQAYADLHNIDRKDAERRLFDHMQTHEGSITYYCIDRWAEFTGLDIMALHQSGVDRIAYREGSREFLTWLQAEPKRVILTTNAHRKSLLFKDTQLKLLAYFDDVVSSHDYQLVKENPEFWRAMQTAIDFDPSRTLFIDDHEGVLAAAQQHGIAHLYCVSHPNSKATPRSNSAFPLIRNLNALVG